tara:strand:- start:220 stop:393 length:174 start_codon:yes stop_codon:yes gene_type:complete
MQEYEYNFEGMFGFEMGVIEAKNLAAANRELKEMFPNDIGADGVWYNMNGDEFAIKW